mmetsp:Transcript_15167/g.57188  ORF Transcript_15167/g.57188 Transcript_15167/m.57188 type:complete len:264 (+) Transcript_15167:298-1089(+)
MADRPWLSRLSSVESSLTAPSAAPKPTTGRLAASRAARSSFSRGALRSMSSIRESAERLAASRTSTVLARMESASSRTFACLAAVLAAAACSFTRSRTPRIGFCASWKRGSKRPLAMRSGAARSIKRACTRHSRSDCSASSSGSTAPVRAMMWHRLFPKLSTASVMTCASREPSLAASAQRSKRFRALSGSGSSGSALRERGSLAGRASAATVAAPSRKPASRPASRLLASCWCFCGACHSSLGEVTSEQPPPSATYSSGPSG